MFLLLSLTSWWITPCFYRMDENSPYLLSPSSEGAAPGITCSQVESKGSFFWVLHDREETVSLSVTVLS